MEGGCNGDWTPLSPTSSPWKQQGYVRGGCERKGLRGRFICHRQVKYMDSRRAGVLQNSWDLEHRQ